MRVVLAEMPSPFNAFQYSGGLKSEIMGDFADSHGQISIRMGAIRVNAHMMGAVHGTQYIRLVLNFHSREHVFFIMLPVS